MSKALLQTGRNSTPYILAGNMTMGCHTERTTDPANRTPRFFFNSCGYVSWGGKHTDELTAADLVEILEFCRSEAQRQGYNDAKQGFVKAVNPFDSMLLGGFPCREWADSYDMGVMLAGKAALNSPS